MDSNRLKLNAEKTKLMVMTTKQKNVHKDLKVFLKGVEVEKVNFAKFLGIIISGNLKWNEYILQSENSLLKYCNKRLAALKLLARDCSLNQRKILAHGLVISKITYCISCWASCPGYLKKRVQEVMSEITKTVYGSRTVPLKHQYWELDWLTLEGWMNYMDILTGSTISDFDKPQDLARSMGREANIRAGKQHWLEENVRVTRAMLAGNIRLGQENIGQSHAHSVFFSARYARCHNISPQELRGLNLNTALLCKSLDSKPNYCTVIKTIFLSLLSPYLMPEYRLYLSIPSSTPRFLSQVQTQSICLLCRCTWCSKGKDPAPARSRRAFYHKFYQ